MKESRFKPHFVQFLPVNNGLKNRTKFLVQHFKLKGKHENTTSKSQNVEDALFMMETQTSFSFIKKKCIVESNQAQLLWF